MIASELCNLEEKNFALNQALNSRTFSRSEQLRAFLRYICEAEIAQNALPVHEYIIGVEVLGRPEGYSPAEDSSVRTRAYDLRQKLEKLYSAELPDEEIQITIPKGTYTPQYIRRGSGPSTALPELPPTLGPNPMVSVSPHAAPRILNISLIVTLLAAGCLAGSAGTWFAAHHRIQASSPDSILTEAWGPLAKSQNTVLLSVATPLSLVVGPLGHEVFGSLNYPAPPEAYPLFRSHRMLSPDTRLGLSFSDNMLAVGTMNAALSCATTLRGFGRSFQLLPDRVASVSALRGHSAILFGAGVDSETIAVTMQDMPLAVEFDAAVREFVIRNRLTGKCMAPTKDATGDLSEVFGLITVKETEDEAAKQQTVVFSGITSVGVQGAAEFFSSAESMRVLKSRIKKFPATYQVVVKCRCNKLALLSSQYFTHQVL